MHEMDGLLRGVQGYMYPNEVELQWSVLIVLYPFTFASKPTARPRRRSLDDWPRSGASSATW